MLMSYLPVHSPIRKRVISWVLSKNGSIDRKSSSEKQKIFFLLNLSCHLSFIIKNINDLFNNKDILALNNTRRIRISPSCC